jgi:hypothetical protein
MISKIEVERFTLSSSKPFDQVRLTSRNGKNAELSIFDVWCSDPNSTVRSAGMTFPPPKICWTRSIFPFLIVCLSSIM